MTIKNPIEDEADKAVIKELVSTLVKGVEDEAEKLGINPNEMSCILYLRMCSRYTPELEVELIRQYKQGKRIGIREIRDFGVTEETKKIPPTEHEKLLIRLQDIIQKQKEEYLESNSIGC